MNKIGIIGCGWLGLHLAKHFATNNKIFTTTTSTEKQTNLQARGFEVTQVFFSEAVSSEKNRRWEFVEELDVLIITIPFSKHTDISLLKNKFERVFDFIGKYNNSIFLMSSVGIYPQMPINIEEHTFANKQLNQNMLYVEEEFRRCFPQINILRLGGLMGGTRMLSKYKITAPEAPVNHVHYQDVCLIVEKMILKGFCGKTYNVVAPLHPLKQEVIDYQNGVMNYGFLKESKGRKILGNRCCQELDYQYQYPDPIRFE